MEEQKELKDHKLLEEEFAANSDNGEEAEDVQEESEEIEEEFDEDDKEQDDSKEEECIQATDEDLIPNKENFYFHLNNSLLTPLNNDSYTTQELIEKIIPEIKLNSKDTEEIGLYTGTLLYKDINFTFAFDRSELRLIPPKDKEHEIEWEWGRKP